MVVIKKYKEVNISYNMYKDYKKSGIIHKLVQKKVQDILYDGISCLEIVEFIENEIKLNTKYDNNNPLLGGIAFPVGTSINNVAAHFTPSEYRNPKVNKDDIIKIDFGVHINGCITDGAFSWCPSGMYDQLIDVAKGATNIGIKNSGPDAILGEIGGYIQEYIESKEIEVNGFHLPVKSIYDLSGHKIDQYIIHAGKAVPNIKLPYYQRMKEGEVYAVETFPTIGSGCIYNDNECNHFMITDNKIYKNDTKKIYDERKTLAFCPRWFDFKIPENDFIKKYPVLKTCDDTVCAQHENTIYIKNNGIEILN